MSKYQFITNCVNSTYEKITDMVNDARDITYETFCKYVDWKDVSEMLGYALHPSQGLMIKNDYAVSFHKSRYEGRPCYYVCWSAIEYIFVKD